MLRHFTLEYWLDDGWYVGRLREMSGVFSQGETLEELEENIKDAYSHIIESNSEAIPKGVKTKDITLKLMRNERN